MDEEDEEAREQEEERAKQRTSEYMDWRRKFDGMKQSVEGQQAESAKIKEQGNNFFKLGLYMQASMMYSEALELQPENPVLYCNRAMAYLKQDMPHEALVDANQSLQIDASKENIKAYWRKAQALMDLDRPEESEEVSDAGLALQAGNDHLNRVRRKARETSALRKLCVGDWTCKMSNGIEKGYSYQADGSMKISIFGQSVPATFELSVEGNPRSMRVAMKPDGGRGPPPPAVPYIFEFHKGDKELWLCTDPTSLPTEFKGPSFDKLQLVQGSAASLPIVVELSGKALDGQCTEYMRELNDAMPLLPPQLPAQPSDADINQEILLMEKMSKLKRRYGAQVHQRSVELAKAPGSSGTEELAKLAWELQQRFTSRRILAAADCSKWPPDPEPAPATEAVEVATAAAAAEPAAAERPAAAAASLAESSAPPKAAAARARSSGSLSCLAGVCGRTS